MRRSIFFRSAVLCITVLGLTACSAGKDKSADKAEDKKGSWFQKLRNTPKVEEKKQSTIWEALRDPKAEQVTKVNQYIWRAALEVLDFLPVKSVDPFSGLIVTGYGTPPGGNRAYRASIFVSDPSLDARSLKLSLQTKSGPVSMSTQRAIEESILTRARQLRKQADQFLPTITLTSRSYWPIRKMNQSVTSGPGRSPMQAWPPNGLAHQPSAIVAANRWFLNHKTGGFAAARRHPIAPAAPRL